MTGGTIKGCYSREGGAIINVNKPNDKNDGSYSEDSHPVVNISGGTIQNNASQMKGSAIQTIYGGAETNVPGGAVAACIVLGALDVAAGIAIAVLLLRGKKGAAVQAEEEQAQ